jgi:serine/threonine protein kinase
MNRRVATKILPFALAMREHCVRAFMNEPRIMAFLNHGNIVPPFALGCESGVHYIVMEFIDGRPLDKFVEELPKESSTFHSIAKLFPQVAGALEHAHQLGVVHRDIEPGNLLVDKDRKLWLIDWGLAQFSDCGALSMAGGAWGILRYMSPELALRVGLVDQRADIYSLGAVLYELLTLKPSIRSQSREEMLHAIASQQPEPPRKLNKAIPPDLEKIVLKAMAKDRAQRYQAAKEMCDALTQFVC